MFNHLRSTSLILPERLELHCQRPRGLPAIPLRRRKVSGNAHAAAAVLVDDGRAHSHVLGAALALAGLCEQAGLVRVHL